MKTQKKKKIIAKSEKDIEKGKPYRLKNLQPSFISIVTNGANRQKKFQVVKQDDFDKMVPTVDASDEEKRDAQKKRSQQYGIEALDSSANLSYPAGNPTMENLYGDPVNLKYPLAREANQLDEARIRNGLARFKQAFETYKNDNSRKIVFARIVDAALKAGIEVSYDENDPIDALLPKEIVDRIKAKKRKAPDKKVAEDFNISEWLDNVGAEIDQTLFAAEVLTVFERPPEMAKSNRENSQETISKISNLEKSVASRDEKIVTLEKANEDIKDKLEKEKKQNVQLRKERDRLLAKNGSLRKGIGGTSSIQTGLVSDDNKQIEKDPKDAPWAAGGDLTQKVDTEKK